MEFLERIVLLEKELDSWEIVAVRIFIFFSLSRNSLREDSKSPGRRETAEPGIKIIPQKIPEEVYAGDHQRNGEPGQG